MRVESETAMTGVSLPEMCASLQGYRGGMTVRIVNAA